MHSRPDWVDLMLSFLFWNLKKLHRTDLVAAATLEHAVNFVLLAECVTPTGELLAALAATTGRRFHRTEACSEKVRVFSCLPESSIHPVFEDSFGHVTIQRIVLRKTDTLLVSVHLPSKLNYSEADQTQFTQRVAQRIRDAEKFYGHCRTVLVGDLNMNPFDTGVAGAFGLHGVMTKSIATQVSRTVDGEEHPYFYNPMWGLFGDKTRGPAGTHYSRRGRPTEFFWNMYDQMLIRPELLNVFDGEVTVATEIAGQSLLTVNGLPDKSVGSDHLPLMFRLNLELEEN